MSILLYAGTKMFGYQTHALNDFDGRDRSLGGAVNGIDDPLKLTKGAKAQCTTEARMGALLTKMSNGWQVRQHLP